MKRILLSVLLIGCGVAFGQFPYETPAFWIFQNGYQAGDSTVADDYLQYSNGKLILRSDGADEKIIQLKNDISDVGVITALLDENKNGGFSIDSANGQTVVKLRGALSDHTYFMNTHVSIGRGGQTQDYGGNVDGAKFTVSDDREPGYGLWDADNYQMMLQSSKDSIGGYVGLAFTSENAMQDRNVGAFINYLKTGNNGKGELHFGTKTATGSLADGIHAMMIDDGSVTIDSTIILPNIPAINSDTVLVSRNDSVGYKVITSTNIYNSDGTLTGNRTVDMGGYQLTFDFVTVDSRIGEFFSQISGLILHNTRGLYKTNHELGQYYFNLAEDGSPHIIKNRANSFPALIVEQKNASSTGDIAQFQNSTGTVASITNDGGIVASIPTGTSDTTLIISNDTIYKKVSSSDNIYTADGTLTGDRTISMGVNSLTFSGTSKEELIAQNRFILGSNGSVGAGSTNAVFSLDNGTGSFNSLYIAGNSSNCAIRFDDSGGINRNAIYVGTDNIMHIGNNNYTGVELVKAAVVGSATLSSSAVLQANSTTKGFLPPRMTGAQAEAISSPAEGLMVYSTDGSGVTITSKGWWGYDGSTWVKLN